MRGEVQFRSTPIFSLPRWLSQRLRPLASGKLAESTNHLRTKMPFRAELEQNAILLLREDTVTWTTGLLSR